MKYASFGSISHGTMRPEDLFPTFADELDHQLKQQPKSFKRRQYRERINEAKKFFRLTTDQQGQLLDELFDALDDFAPPYAYFGTHPGDGADYGFWLHEGFDQDFDGLKVSDTSEVPDDYTGEVLHVNDHGNCALYSAENGKLTEIWSVV
jgi:hypothetical protein